MSPYFAAVDNLGPIGIVSNGLLDLSVVTDRGRSALLQNIAARDIEVDSDDALSCRPTLEGLVVPRNDLVTKFVRVGTMVTPSTLSLLTNLCE